MTPPPPRTFVLLEEMPALRIVASAVPGVDVAAFMEQVIGEAATIVLPGFQIHRFTHTVSPDACVVIGNPIVVDLWVLDGARSHRSAAAAAFAVADMAIIAVGPERDPDLAPLEFFRVAFGTVPPPLVACVALGATARPRLPHWLRSMQCSPTLVVPPGGLGSDSAVREYMAPLFDRLAELGDGLGSSPGRGAEMRSATALMVPRQAAHGRARCDDEVEVCCCCGCCGCCDSRNGEQGRKPDACAVS